MRNRDPRVGRGSARRCGVISYKGEAKSVMKRNAGFIFAPVRLKPFTIVVALEPDKKTEKIWSKVSWHENQRYGSNARKVKSDAKCEICGVRTWQCSGRNRQVGGARPVCRRGCAIQ